MDKTEASPRQGLKRAAAVLLLLAACDTQPRAPLPAATPERSVAVIRAEGNHLVGQD